MSIINNKSKLNIYGTIIPFISHQIGKILSSSEISYIKKKLSKLDINGQNLPLIIRYLILDIINKQKLKSSNDTYIEDGNDYSKSIKEYLKKQIGTTSEDNRINEHKFYSRTKSTDKLLSLEVAIFLQFNSDNLFNLSKKINPKSKRYYSYIMLDTDNVSSELSTDDDFVWNLNDEVPVYQKGIINVPHKIYPIVAMRLGQMTFSNVHEDTYTAITTSITNRFAFSLKNFDSQSLIAQNGLKFHFLQKYNVSNLYSSSFTTSSFDENRGWFRFRKPHNKTDLLHLHINDIFSPLNRISMPDIEFSFPAIQKFNETYTDQSIGSLLNYLLMTDLYAFMLPMWYGNTYPQLPQLPLIGGPTLYEFIISGFTTDDPITDAAVIAEYNGSHTLVNFIGPVFQSVVSAPDIAGITFAGTDIPITITWIYKPRLTGVLELISEMSSDEKIT
jgi:hypothetical protein